MLALRLAEPELFFTVTQVGDTWATVRQRMQALRRQFARQGHDLQTAWAVECNPAHTGHHAHVAAWGRGPSKTKLGDLAAKAGLGHVANVIPFRADHASYMLKQPLRSACHLEHSLKLNGGTFLHASRRFWREGSNGPSIPGGLDAVMRKTGVRRGHVERASGWVLVHHPQVSL